MKELELLGKLTEKNAAAEYCNETIRFVRESVGNICERLYTIGRNELWKGTWDTFGDFLLDCGISRPNANKMMNLYDRVVIQLKFDKQVLYDAPWSNLYTMLPMMTDVATARKIIIQAAKSRRGDLERIVLEHKMGKPCEHEEIIKICATCKIRIYDTEDNK